MTSESNKKRKTVQAEPPLPHFGMEEDNVPTQIGHFKIIELLSASMALVYKAEQQNPRRIVALKIPRGGKLISRESRQRFQREVSLAAKVEHAGIVPVLNAGDIDGIPYYTMPFIEGLSLDKYIENKHPARKERLNIFLRICEVVQSLHSDGLVHRDLKPENIMIDQHGDVRLLDFGLARACEEMSNRITIENALLGTLQFMAPEQTSSAVNKEVSPATDVYALGILLYCLLTDAFPYNVTGNRDDVLKNIREAVPPAPSEKDPSITPELDKAVLKALEKDPARRQQNAAEFANSLNLTGKTIPEEQPKIDNSGNSGRLIMVLGLALILAGIAAGIIKSRNPEKTLPAKPSPMNLNKPDNILKAPPQPSHPSRVFLQIEIIKPEVITKLAQGHPVSSKNASVPRGLWPLYEKVSKTLKEEFRHRRNGAVLIKLDESQYYSSANLVLYNRDRETLKEEIVIPGSAITIYLPEELEHQIEYIIDGNVIRKTVSVEAGKVEYLQF